eukprot:XP_001699251.1 predicted protein [Chlamydomonas reinhardtii]
MVVVIHTFTVTVIHTIIFGNGWSARLQGPARGLLSSPSTGYRLDAVSWGRRVFRGTVP